MKKPNDEGKMKKPYCKPTIQKVKLIAEEAVLTACKNSQSTAKRAGQGHAPCSTHHHCAQSTGS